MRCWGSAGVHTLYSLATPHTPERFVIADLAEGVTHGLSPCMLPGGSAVSADLACLSSATLSIYPKQECVGELMAGVTSEAALGSPFQATLLWRSAGSSSAGSDAASPAPPAPMPLLLVPHGGPHSSFTSSFSPHYAYLASLGVAVLLVNYRGSTGYPLATLASLPGRCGVADVSDCFQAALAALAWGGVAAAAQSPLLDPRNLHCMPPLPHFPRLDPTRVAVSGGSHGGFLASHLVSNPATRPLFRAAVLRNPVTNIASMLGSTDIPDWCLTEALGVGESGGAREVGHLTAGDRERMRRLSPISLLRFLQTEKQQGGEAVGAAAPHLPPLPLQPPSIEDGLLASATPALGAHAAAVSGIPSPAHHATPLLLMLGLKDRRVPPSQGFELWHALRAQAATPPSARTAQLLVYPEDTHALDGQATDGDAWTHLTAWLAHHLK